MTRHSADEVPARVSISQLKQLLVDLIANAQDAMRGGGVLTHGGTLTVENLPGEGACFRLSLPAASAPA